MRTRILSKMTNAEVEEYLDRNDIIFIPVGTVELHGRMPLDCEYTWPAGLALACAEKVDGLVLDGLKYFYCGATTNGRGTVQMSCNDGYHYLKAIAYSLMNQGFKRQVYVTGHGPSYLTLGPLVCDVFDETKINICWLDYATASAYAKSKFDPARDGVDSLDLVNFGCYEIMNCKDDLVIDPSAPPVIRKHPELPKGVPDWSKMDLPVSMQHMIHLIDFAKFECASGFYFGSIEDHGGDTGAIPSIEERDELCAEGLKQLRVMVDLMDMPRYVADIAAQREFNETVVKPKYRHLPKNKFSDWN